MQIPRVSGNEEWNVILPSPSVFRDFGSLLFRSTFEGFSEIEEGLVSARSLLPPRTRFPAAVQTVALPQTANPTSFSKAPRQRYWRG